MATTVRFPGAQRFLPNRRTLPLLRVAAQSCHGCDLYSNATQAVFGVCLVCAGANDRTIQDSSGVQRKLLEEIQQATDRANAAAESFSSIIKDIPSDMPHPDGVFRITQASRELSSARAELLVAHRRLNDFLSRGVIPEDLKAS